MSTVPHNRGIDEVCAELEKMFDAGEKAALLGAVRALLGLRPPSGGDRCAGVAGLLGAVRALLGLRPGTGGSAQRGGSIRLRMPVRLVVSLLATKGIIMACNGV